MATLDLVSIRLFVRAVEEGSMSRAAVREHIALPALSKRIAGMEDALGVSLLIREARGVKLTAAGGAFLQHARELLFSYQRMTGELKDYAHGVRGYVRVAASTSALMQFVPEDLKAFLVLHPAVRIDVLQRPSAEVAKSVRDGLADIGILPSSIAGHGLLARPYQSDTLVLGVQNEHVLASHRSVSFREVLRFDFIEMDEGSAVYALMMQAAADVGLPLKVRVRVRSYDVMCRMIQAGIGVGLMPRRAVRPYAARMGVRTIPLREPWAKREIKLYVRDEQTLSPSASQLFSFLVTQAAEASKGR